MTIKERSESKKAKPIVQCDLDGNELTKWKSMYHVGKMTCWKYKWQLIGKVCRGERLTAYGFIWKYA